MTSSSSSGWKNNTSNNKNNSNTPYCAKVGLKRGPWTPEEILSSYVHKQGEGGWRTLPKRACLLRCGKSCRLRWMNYLRPSIKRGQIGEDEKDLILCLHRLIGNIHEDSTTSISPLEMSFNEVIGNDNRHEYIKEITTLNADQDSYNLENSDGFIMGLSLRYLEQDLHHHTDFNTEDDVFASFFYSFINLEDVDVHQHPRTAKNPDA
ncbi:hypothetical protein MKX03_034391 [Papaver bracteatum]|nr:hypothetical protein MKX03_034391 [Papaver bracteatum]